MKALEEEALKQYRAGWYNRRVASEMVHLLRSGLAADDDPCELVCTCGREDCGDNISVTLSEYDRVHRRPGRFIVSPGHATDLDDVVTEADGYWIVELKPPYRF